MVPLEPVGKKPSLQCRVFLGQQLQALSLCLCHHPACFPRVCLRVLSPLLYESGTHVLQHDFILTNCVFIDPQLQIRPHSEVTGLGLPQIF